MRTFATFFTTMLIAVPASWHALGASIQTDGPATRPKHEELEVNDATVSVQLDRGVLMAGGKLVATLVASADAKKTISLDVTALEDMGYGPERVENPPRQVGERRVTVEAAPGGGKPVQVSFTLGAPGKKGVVRWFDIVVRKAGKRGEDDATAKVGAATWS